MLINVVQKNHSKVKLQFKTIEDYNNKSFMSFVQNFEDKNGNNVVLQIAAAFFQPS